MIGKIICGILFFLGMVGVYYGSLDTHPYITDTKTVNLETNQTNIEHDEGIALDNGHILVLGIMALIVACVVLTCIIFEY